MKKLILFTLSLLLITTTLFWTACSKTDDEGWTDEEKASYENVITIQDEVADNLDEWFLSMDSLDAIDMAQQAFEGDLGVTEAIINSQGIAVQYANGMRGGIYLNPLDGETDKSPETLLDDLQANNNMNLKSIVNKRKMILLNPHYWERSYYTDQVYSISRSNLNRPGIDLSTFYKNEEATVDRFTELSGYGIIQIYSHGWAWPKQENITDIYLLTGETANETTSKKYWNELKTGNIPLVKTAGRNNSYLVSERFIENYNDFSNDTVLFYGGFCYSFLGDWPDLVESFADGAYFGFDWKVYTYRNANWSVNLMALMSDTSKLQPINTETWMNNSDMEKSYWDSQDERTVHIYYAGDGNLTLWGDVSINLIALSDDGAPVSTPGEAGVAYPFRCEVVSNITELEYVWDIGNGGTPVTAGNAVNITWSEDGDYVLKVDVKDKSNGNIIGSATANVQIGNDDILDFILSCNTIQFSCGPQEAIQFSPPYSGGVTTGGNTDMVWNGLNFSAYDETENTTWSINGSLSNDGKRVSLVAESTYTSEFQQSKYTWTVTDYPFSYYEPNGIEHAWDRPGVVYQTFIPNIQNHLTLSGYTTLWGETYTVTEINWATLDELMITIFWWDK